MSIDEEFEQYKEQFPAYQGELTRNGESMYFATVEECYDEIDGKWIYVEEIV